MDDNSAVAPFDRTMLDAANDTLVTAFMDDSMVGSERPDCRHGPTTDDVSLTTDGRRLDSSDDVFAFFDEIRAKISSVNHKE